MQTGAVRGAVAISAALVPRLGCKIRVYSALYLTQPHVRTSFTVYADRSVHTGAVRDAMAVSAALVPRLGCKTRVYSALYLTQPHIKK